MTYITRRMLTMNVLLLLLPAKLAAQAQYIPTIDELGNYRWTYLAATGDKREFIFIPASRIAPTIAVEAEIVADSIYRFSYSIGNAPSASQRLRSCVVDVAPPTAIHATAVGWEAIQPKTVSRLSWYMRRTEHEITGILPGGNVSGFELRSPALPGVVEFRCRGNVARPEYPEDLPEDIELQVVKLAIHDDVPIMALGPAIPGPMDPLPVVIRRIIRNYRQPIAQSNGARKNAIGQALRRMGEVNFDDERATRSAVVSAAELVALPEADEWARELSRGLEMALKHILNRLPPPRWEGREWL